MDSYIRLRETDERLERLREILGVWKGQQIEERRLRKSYATILMWFLGIELSVIFVAFFLVGFRVLHVEQWVASIFLAGALTQTTSLVLVVVKYLFPSRTTDLFGLIAGDFGNDAMPRRTRGGVDR